VPRELNVAVAQGWTLHKDGCKSAKDRLPGARYILDNDLSVILVFDANGYIAGMQMGVPKSAITPGHLIKAATAIDDDSNYAVSAYFVHPSRICDQSKSRTSDEFQNQGTAEKVYLQVGPKAATDVLEIPLTQDEQALAAQKWTKGKCLPTMGMHYWYNNTVDTDCNELVPFCLLYNSGKFNGFCFAVAADFDNANPHRFEHPTGKDAKLCCMDPYPKCFDDTGLTTNKQSTMHVYLDSTPYLNFC